MTLSYEYLDENNSYDFGIPAFGSRLAKIPLSKTFTQPGLQDRQINHLIDFRIDRQYNDNVRFNAGTVASQNRKNWNSIYTGRVVEQLDPLNPDKSLGDVDRFYGSVLKKSKRLLPGRTESLISRPMASSTKSLSRYHIGLSSR